MSFTVPGAPVAQPREKSTVFKDKAGNWRSRTHPVDTIRNAATGEKKPHPIVQWKADVKHFFAAEYPNHVPFRDVPLHFELVCILPRPQYLMGKKHLDGLVPCFKAMDWDNLGKSAADALKGLAYVDDRLIAWGEVRKFYHEKNGRPRAEIRIEEL